MNRAQDIRDQIRGGGVPVTDRFGRIQGVVSEGTGPVADVLGAFGLNRNVYTGGPGFAPSTSQLMSYRPSGIASLPEVGSVFELDGRSFLSTVNGPVELKGTAEQDVVTDFSGMRSGATLENPVLDREQLNNPNFLGNVPLQGVPGGIDPRTGMPNLSPQPQNIGLTFGRGPMTEDPRAVAEREQILDQVRAAASGEPLPSNENMYGRGMQDFGPMTPDQLETYQDSYLSPQYGTINDPTAQAGVLEGIGNFFTETIPGVFDYSTPAKAKSKAKSKADRFKDTNVRTKPVGPVEYFTNLFG